MPVFLYKAKNGPSQTVSGRIEAEHLDAAVARVSELGYVPLAVEPVEKSSTRKLSGFEPLGFLSKRVSPGEKALFTRQLADLVSAGVPVLRALRVIEGQVYSARLHQVVTEIRGLVKDGVPLSGALERYPEIFSGMYVNMVNSGELGGNLDVVLNRLADLLETDQQMRAQVGASLIYPAFILVVGGVVIFALMTWVIPQMTLIFEDMSESLPLPTILLIRTSEFFSQFWWGILFVLALVVLYVIRWRRHSHGRQVWDAAILKIPLIGKLVLQSEVGRFARTLGTLLHNGVTIVNALRSVTGVLTNTVLQVQLKKVTEDVANGAGLSTALKGSPFFPEAALNMIAVGEESGRLHESLYKLATFYERGTQRIIKSMTAMVEPILILTLGLIVGFIVMAMLLPVFQMNMMIG